MNSVVLPGVKLGTRTIKLAAGSICYQEFFFQKVVTIYRWCTSQTYKIY